MKTPDSDVQGLIANLEESLAAAKTKASDARAEHLAWCKKFEDLTPCPPPLAVMAMLDAARGGTEQVRHFVEGFN